MNRAAFGSAVSEEKAATCFDCQHYDPAGNPPNFTCSLHRPQTVYWNAAERQVIRPSVRICLDDDYSDMVNALRRAGAL